MTMKLLAGIVLGALAGFAYHKIIGCSTGACPIVRNPWASTLYGALMGMLLAGSR